MAVLGYDDQIDSHIKYDMKRTRSPEFQMKPHQLWPNTAKMRGGDTYVIVYDKPKMLAKKMIGICIEKTGKTLEENDLMVFVLKDESGIIILKL